MSAGSATYGPGEWVAAAASEGWLLVELPPTDERVLRCWSLLSVQAPTDDILDVLISGGIRNAPAFALVRISGSERRAIARGSASVSVTIDGTEGEPISAAPNTVWADHVIDAEAEVLVLVGDRAEASTVELPMTAGVTMASGIRVQITADARAERALESTTPDVYPVSGAPAPDGPPVVGVPLLSGSTQVFDQAEADVVSVTEAEPEPAGSYDHLFGATQRPTPLIPVAADQSALAVAPVASADPVDSSHSASTPADPAFGQTAGWFTTTPEANAPDVPTAAASTAGGLIDSLPWMNPTAGPAQKTPTVADEAPSNVSMTVDRSALLKTAQAEASIVGPTVLAGYCPVGHLTPPHAPACRVCGAPIAEQQGFEIARPVLGLLRLTTGDTVSLDRGVLIGRAPEINAQIEGRPHVLRLASPENDLSRNHAEVVLDGWHVYIRDLGSTNGTVVTLPGQHPMRLRQNDLQLLEHGTAVTFADEITVTFEVTL